MTMTDRSGFLTNAAPRRSEIELVSSQTPRQPCQLISVFSSEAASVLSAAARSGRARSTTATTTAATHCEHSGDSTLLDP